MSGILKYIKKNYLLLTMVFMLLLCGCGKESLTDVWEVLKSGNGDGAVLCVSSDRYAHETLSEKQQLVYDEMLDAIMNMKENVRLSTTEPADVDICYHAICADYGEIFWVDSCSYAAIVLFGRTCAVKFSITYAFTPEQVADYRKQMQPVIEEYLRQLMACESDYEKTELLYRRLIREVAYDGNADQNQNILSVFLGKATVCQGYACAVQYLLQQVGIPCVIVTGTAQGQPHAWNMAMLDGDYYYLDVTWGNADFLGGSDDASGGINYGYLNITSEELLVNHQPDVDFFLPSCTDTANNYYVKHDLYITSPDPGVIGEKIANAYEQKSDSISMKFASGEMLAQAKSYLIDEKHLADYCRGISQIYYVQDKDLNILTIYLE